MTTQELAQQILMLAEQALEQEKRVPVYLDDIPEVGYARAGLEAIIKLCQDVPPPAQDDFRQYEKKVRHDRTKISET
jgi:hypothetical protein